MMKRSSIILFFAALYSLGSSQDINILVDTLTLDSAITPVVDMSIRAMDWVKLSPGFQYEAQQNKEFRSSYYAFGSLDDDNTYGGHPDTAISNLVGNDGMVGAIPGSFSVSPSGAAVYSIPIQCPEGINGMTPGVSLVYNSQAGNGVAGYGWNIASASSISRSTKNYYHDDEVSIINWDESDPLILDGQRMIEVQDYGDSISYKMDGNPRVKIMAYNCSSEVTKYFYVYYGDGKRYEYQPVLLGSSILDYYTKRDSCGTIEETTIQDTSNYILNWNLSKITDPFNNYIEYDYTWTSLNDSLKQGSDTITIPGEFCNETIIHQIYYSETNKKENVLLSSISYGHGDSTFYSIDFDYETRFDSMEYYVGGKKIKSNKRLKEISVRINTETNLRVYTLSYDNLNYSVLKDIELEGLNGSTLNKTAFTWDYQNFTFTNSSNFGFSRPDSIYDWLSDGYELFVKPMTFDLNGDNQIDFLVKYALKKEIDNGEDPIYFIFKGCIAAYLNTGSPETLNYFWHKYYDDNGPYNYGPAMGLDVDFDNKDEILLRSETFSENGKHYVKYPCMEYNNDSSTLITNENLDLIFEIDSYTPSSSFNIIPSDFTGDGSLDYLLFKDGIKTYLSSKGITYELDWDFGYPSGLKFIDFNGNGKTDLLLEKTGTIEIWEYDYNSSDFSKIYTHYGINDSCDIIAGEINGDGNTDLLIKDSSNNWKVYISTGKEFILGNYNIPVDLSNDADKVLFADFDQDGKSDIVQKDNGVFKLYINNGYGFSIKLTQNSLSSYDLSNLGNYDDDNIHDIFVEEDTCFYSISPDKSYNTIKTITNGMGQQISLEYSFNSYLEGDIEKSLNESTTDPNPYIFVKSFAKTLSSYSNDPETKSYAYSNPLIQAKGKGFMGFGKRINTSIIPGRTLLNTETYKLVEKIEDESYDFVPDSSTVYLNGTHLQTKANHYDVLQKNGETYCVLDSSIQVDELNDIQRVSLIRNYDNYLNPGVTIEKILEDGTRLVSLDSTIISYENSLNSNIHILGLPEIITTINTRPGEERFVKTKEVIFNTDGTIYRSYLFKNTNEEIKSEYDYDQFGNITQEKIIATNDSLVQSSLRERTTVFRYSDNGRFLISKTNSLGFVDSLVYSNDLGTVIKKIDGNNQLETEYSYDDFGNLIETKHPDHKVIKGLRWAEDHTDAPSDGVYYSYQQSIGSEPVFLFYDLDGKVLREVNSGFNGEKIYVDKKYCIDGLDSLVSLPYNPSSQVYWTHYYYDNLRRPDSIVSPDSRYTDYSYSKRTLTTYAGKGSNDQKTIKTTNGKGETIISEDDQGNKVYTFYNSRGLPDEFRMNAGPYKVELEYDKFGNRTKIIDPNAGEINTLYDVFGQLVKQVDASGNITEIQYDKLGRITQETLGNNTKTYTYDTNFTGALTSLQQTSPSNSITYDYDHFGRLISSSESFDGYTIDNEFSYDFIGRITSSTYPDSSNLVIENHYNNYGFLERITALGKTLWECEDVDHFGNIVQYNQGSASSNITYNNFGELTAQSFTNGRREYSYGFDDFLNLEYRQDDDYVLKEEFSYDELNRLTGSDYYENGSFDSQNLEIEYDNAGMGNIISRSSVGDKINYGENAGPHALTSIKNLDPNYRPPPQVIEYTDFQKLSYILDTLDNGDTLTLAINYGFDNQRRKSVLNRADGSSKIKYFFGDYEIITDNNSPKEYLFVNSPTGLCAIIETYYEGGSRMQKVWHAYTDHLGSLIYLENADNSNDNLNYSYDAWGNPRKHSDWLDDSPVDELIADRGYTGHEHLTEFRLINMNGRVYDPILGRFLSPDPYVQMPGFVDGFNRYAYCLNNPLIYTDPTGEKWWKTVLGTLGINLVGIPTYILTGGSFGFVGYYDDEEGKVEIWAGTVWNGGTAQVQLVFDDRKLSVYGSSVFDFDASFNGSNNDPGSSIYDNSNSSSYYYIRNNKDSDSKAGYSGPLYASLNFFSENNSSDIVYGFHPADMGSDNYITYMQYTLSYVHYLDPYKRVDELFDFSKAGNNAYFRSSAWGDALGGVWVGGNENFRFTLFPSVYGTDLRLYSPTTGFHRASHNILTEKYFPPTPSGFSDSPYQIQLDGWRGNRPTSGGRFRFDEFRVFKLWVLNLLTLPPASYWRIDN